MAVPRDPAFWKRFSMAVHMDEEKGGQYEMAKSDGWLARETRKKSKRTCLCWSFWIVFLLVIAAIVAVIIWLLESGVLDDVHIGNGNGVDSPNDDPDVASTEKRGLDGLAIDAVGQLLRRRVWHS